MTSAVVKWTGYDLEATEPLNIAAYLQPGSGLRKPCVALGGGFIVLLLCALLCFIVFYCVLLCFMVFFCCFWYSLKKL